VTDGHPNPYPLVLTPILYRKPWGGDRLATFGKAVNPGELIGESWELADLGSTSASGAGGGAAVSLVAQGPLAGETVHAAMDLWGDDLLPAHRRTAEGGFPLLIKFLDARQNLSVQVHPSEAYARAHPPAKLKTECWFIVEHEPGAVIYKGFKPGVTLPEFERALRTDAALTVEMLDAVPAVVGECHNLPSGTLHALGAGVLIAEVQTPSDTTFRTFDWGRTGRELHIEEALECISVGPTPKAVDMRRNPPDGGVLRTEFFSVWRASASDENDLPVGHGAGCFALTVLGGQGSLFSDDGDFAPVDLVKGRTVLVPGLIAGGASIVGAENSRVECLIASLPT